jgi:hypothetical protein
MKKMKNPPHANEKEHIRSEVRRKDYDAEE